MSYLNINGYTVKTKHGGELSFNEVAGHRQYSFNGLYQFSRNALARRWQFTTIPLPKNEALALAGMLNMQGDAWPFAVPSGSRPISTTTAHYYTNKRRDAYNTSGSGNAPVASIVSCFAADGAEVYDKNGVSNRVYSGVTGNILCEPGTTNILSGTEADPEDAAHLTLINTSGSASKTTESNRAWVNTKCIKVVTGANAADGIRTGNITSGYTPGNVVVGTAHIRPDSGGEDLRITFWEDTGGGYVLQTPVNYTIISDTDGWQRIEVSHTTSGSSVGLQLGVLNQTASANTFYIDGLQVEEQASGVATSWVDPDVASGVRANGDLQYSNLLTSMTKGFTINAWVKHLRLGVSSNHIICDSGIVAANTADRFLFYFDTIGQPTALARSFPAGANSDLSAATSAPDAGWHMWTAVFDPSVPKLSLYKDGALAASDTTLSGTRLFDPSKIVGDFHVANNATMTAWGPGPVSQLMVLPFAAPLNFITGLYNSGNGTSGIDAGVLPLAVSGTALGAGESSIACYGQVDAITNSPHYSSITNAWEMGAATVTFSLMEATGQ